VLVRANSLYFTSGYVGYLAVWILDTIQRCAQPSGHFATHLQTFVFGLLELLNDRRGEGRSAKSHWLDGSTSFAAQHSSRQVQPSSHASPHPACSPPCPPACRFLPRPGVERARRVLRLGLQALSPHFCLARGMHLVSGTRQAVAGGGCGGSERCGGRVFDRTTKADCCFNTCQLQQQGSCVRPVACLSAPPFLPARRLPRHTSLTS
jgi:hypothetical protein